MFLSFLKMKNTKVWFVQYSKWHLLHNRNSSQLSIADCIVRPPVLDLLIGSYVTQRCIGNLSTLRSSVWLQRSLHCCYLGFAESPSYCERILHWKWRPPEININGICLLYSEIHVRIGNIIYLLTYRYHWWNTLRIY